MSIKALALGAVVCVTVLAGNARAQIDVSPVTVENKASALPKDWNKTAAFMEIFVRSYKDSDGDGIGDFNGLTSQLDYLHDLGVTGIWLMPIMPSEDGDHAMRSMIIASSIQTTAPWRISSASYRRPTSGVSA